MAVSEKFREYLNMDGQIAFNMAIYNKLSSIGDSVYSGICGGFVEGVHQWATHNIYNVVECENDKYVGWILELSNGSERKVYIDQYIMEIVPKDWSHAKNLFNKYLRVVPQ